MRRFVQCIIRENLSSSLLIQWKQGGHFAAFEVPEVFLKDLENFVAVVVKRHETHSN